ncbi:MAG TPA: bifunctional phosphopantothenoylcysteine decarboxylase/phosphopantothenate--cysteine ligase CoaBC [Geminicoccus sp.]|uniref:bifunctional phosphopantothenoylcysteine decarboxylase/phosphopantothenate--cysteine ligase CoaBC n=1 Tax=Geminicoccus sp. TaxID=2024832 RepID=UPI002E36300A|nr:bifunctional phosphopantothenoylcysteine decarboxylase/phosphopantothenate--cysteine ligase CoaBC [Geminicoccus sp.]HEX2525126.1 bifunctional phosphopantothenoylcysteine decarboxylase/phosphopantothenate--cysteine ligase CoaBC [Geminicoccus sp.]
MDEPLLDPRVLADGAGGRLLLVIGGGIAAYKCLELIRRLKDRGIAVRCVMTRSAAQFVTPLSAAALSVDKVYTELFSLTDEAEMGHIRLSREADLVLVAPATADLLAKMVHGQADDLASTVLLATDKPVMVAPAMNPMMWNHPATRRNVAQLKADGVAFVGPDAGDMACGEVGSGRMAEPARILEEVLERLAAPRRQRPLAGLRALVTSGPTREPIDPVRFIMNHSSGKQGHAIAGELAAAGADVILVSGPVSLPDPPGVRVVRVETAREMLAACQAALPIDVAVCAAAVADWRPAHTPEQKIKKEAGAAAPVLQLVENPDILSTISAAGPQRPRLVIGFAAETENVVAQATRKRARKNCDWILGNDVSPSAGTFGGDSNQVTLVTGDGPPEPWPATSKREVARRLALRIAGALGHG